MPRGARKPADDRIMELESKKAEYQTKIDNLKAKISDIDAKITNLKDGQNEKQLEALLKTIKASGKTPEEVISALNIKAE